MRLHKELLSIFLVIAILLSAFGYVPVIKAVSRTITYNREDTFGAATIDDDFADSRILVLLSKDASKRRSAYSITDFSEIRPTKVESLTAEMYEHLTQKNNTRANKERVENFKHVLCVELSTPGK